jgi:alanine racemase
VLTVDVDAVAANWRHLATLAAPADCAAVVKADAYGLGAAAIAPALRASGCVSFVVATVDEALALRAVLPAADIYELGGVPPGAEDDLIQHGIIPVLNHLGEIRAMQETARNRDRRLPVAVHIDTGMNRLGLGIDEVETLIDEPERLDGLYLRLWMTHLACADEDQSPMNFQQLGRFATALNYLPDAPASLANSSGVFLGRTYHYDMVRPGCALYGVNPTPAKANPMRAVARLDARVLQVRNVDAPMTVGYGATHTVTKRGRVATLALGYADGYHRTLGGTGNVFFNGVAAPVIGRISMDLVTVDVTHLPETAVHPGVFAEVMGPNRPVDTIAKEAGTIGYEILTSLGRRYHRIHLGAAGS